MSGMAKRIQTGGFTVDQNAELKSRDERISRLETLLTVEADFRSAASLRELIFAVANETRKCVDARQTFVIRRAKARGDVYIDTVSHITAVDRNAPMVRWLERVFQQALGRSVARTHDKINTPMAFEMPPQGGENVEVIPFGHGLIVPLGDREGEVFAALVLLNEKPFSAMDSALLERLRDVCSHAWLAHEIKPNGILDRFMNHKTLVVASILALVILFVPVSLTTLAPVEVVARHPFVVAAPIDGVIEEILVEPNSLIKKDTPIFSFVNTNLQAQLSIAKRSRNVARARLQTSRQSALISAQGRRELAISQAELDLAAAELNYAQNQFDKTIVRAQIDGFVVFDRKSDWQGKPVSTGERVVEIANPSLVEYRIDLAVSDAIVLKENAKTKVFLDSNPLAPADAYVTSANYRAHLSTAEQLVYAIYARDKDGVDHLPRIGARGTAQIFGEKVSLGFYLFRRPLSTIRQSLGW